MITMLSDFGHQDAYVGVMKGAITAIAPDEITCDLTHVIPPQDILAARFNLMMAYSYFPQGTIHLAVVDPQVGTSRRAIAVKYARGFLVGPDNGLFSGVLLHEHPTFVVSLTNSHYWRVPEVSDTFHGRDIFAPTAAHLAKGVAIERLGDRIDPSTLTMPDLSPCRPPLGSVQYIDGFGNLITNIPAQFVAGKSWQITIGSPTQRPLSPEPLLGIKTYADVSIGGMAALVGSHGYVEIACNGGNAAEALGMAVGDEVRLGVSL